VVVGNVVVAAKTVEWLPTPRFRCPDSDSLLSLFHSNLFPRSYYIAVAEVVVLSVVVVVAVVFGTWAV
jgi:hypothetical protein